MPCKTSSRLSGKLSLGAHFYFSKISVIKLLSGISGYYDVKLLISFVILPIISFGITVSDKVMVVAGGLI